MTAPTSNETAIAQFLTSRGLPPVDVAGFLGNFEVESEYSPTAYNPNEGAIGIAQWEGPRRTGPTGLDAYASASGGSEQDLSTQLGYLWNELTTSESGTLTALQGVSSPAEAAGVIDAKFERSEDTDGSAGRALRQSNASRIYDELGAGNLTGSAVTATSAGGATQGIVGAKPANWIDPPIPNPALKGFGSGAPAVQPSDSSVLGSWIKPIVTFAAEALFVVGGVVLVLLGVYRASAPVRKA